MYSYQSVLSVRLACGRQTAVRHFPPFIRPLLKKLLSIYLSIYLFFHHLLLLVPKSQVLEVPTFDNMIHPLSIR